MILRNNVQNFKIGSVMQKVILLLAGGFGLLLSGGNLRSQFKIMKGVSKEWQSINRRSLHEAIRRLYKAKMIDYKENADGTITLILSDNGKKKALQYNLDKINIKKPKHWDKLWRVVIFDIPEYLRQNRDVFAKKLKQFGFYHLQKSVFIYPYQCKDEVDFIVEFFNLRPYVRFFIVKEIDINLQLKHYFNLW